MYQTISIANIPHFQISTPKGDFVAPKDWAWEGQWEICPQIGSLITDDFVVKEWTDLRYETLNSSDGDDSIITQWFSKVRG